MLTLHPYQVKAEADIRKAWKKHRRVLLVLPTGAGKTVVAASIAKAEAERGKRVLVLAHRRELITQVRARLLAAGAPDSVMVASIQASARRLASGLPDADVVVFDEAHHMKARTWSELSRHYGAAKVLGLTATPYRYDGQPLTDCFDVIVTGPTYEELFELGHLAKPLVYSWKAPDLQAAKMSGGDYAKGEGDRIRQLIGCPVEHWEKHAKGLPSVYYAVNIDHAKQVVARFNRARIPARLLTKDTSLTERDQIGADLESGRVKIVVNVEVLTEGWDMPAVRCAILGRPTRSLVLHRQMCGRVMRAGVKPIILDHCGNALLLGEPWKEIAPSLAEALPSTGKHGSVESRSRTCPECGSEVSLAAPRCLACDYVFWSVVPDEDASRHLELLNGPSVRERAVEMVRGGMRVKRAADALGISKTTAYAWCSQAYREARSEMRLKAVDLAANGVMHQDIAHELGITKCAVASLLSALPPRRNVERRSVDVKRDALLMYMSGMSRSEVASSVGVGYSTVRSWTRELNASEHKQARERQMERHAPERLKKREAKLAKQREKKRLWYFANREKVAEKQRMKYAANPEKFRERQRRYASREDVRQRYRASDKERYRLKRAAHGSDDHTSQDATTREGS